ncbi:MAG TPA: ABC transporter substrate-binding protein [Chloroflexota bacterium]|nr:ABC transporter substrate-binding protein [Chloroflexota bacterium]
MERSGNDFPLAEYIRDLRNQYETGQIPRHEFLRWAAMLGASLPLLKLWAPDLALAASRTDAPMAPQRGGTLRVTCGQPTTVEPQHLTDVNGAATVHPVCEQLVRVGTDMVPRPHLAESWSASADAKTWTFKLRKGVTFNNGAPFTADDVVWTMKYLLDPKTASTTRTTITYLSAPNIEKVDDHTVRFHLDRSVAVFPADLSNYMIVILPKNWPGDFRTNPIGTGPYLLKELVTGDHATYARNPNYWRKPLPYLDGLRITYVKSGMAEIAQLISGQSDVQLFTDPTQIRTLSRAAKVKVLTASSAVYYEVYGRADQKPFSDNRVREAFKYMVNRQQLVKIVYSNYGDLGNDHVVAPVYPEFTSNGVRQQDYAKAKALLAAAGYPNGLQLDFYGMGASGSVGEEMLTAVAVQQMFAPAGVKLRMRPEPISTFYNHWTDVPFAVVNWVGRPTVNAMLNLAYRSNVPWNAAHWSDPTFDTWLDELDATVDMAKRKALCRKIEDRMTHQGPAIIYGFQNAFRAVRSNVHGVVASPISHADLDAAWLSPM